MNIKAREFAARWNNRWYGFWAEEHEVGGDPFSLDEHIDPTWRPSDHQRLIEYLKLAPIAAIAQNSKGKCAFCDRIVLDSCYRTDGKWLWTDSLVHLVESHAFILPDRLVEHIRSNKYLPPSTVITPTDQLPWPSKSEPA